MKSLSVVSDDELQKYYKTISNNVKRIRKVYNVPTKANHLIQHSY